VGTTRVAWWRRLCRVAETTPKCEGVPRQFQFGGY
jgi:hypothetical protein